MSPEQAARAVIALLWEANKGVAHRQILQSEFSEAGSSDEFDAGLKFAETQGWLTHRAAFMVLTRDGLACSEMT